MTAIMLPPPSCGQSDEAKYVTSARAGIILHLTNTATFGRDRAFEEIEQIAAECGVAGWDGNGAPAVTSDSVAAASRFLSALPFGTPSPSVSVDPDGQFSFEWYASPRWIVSVSLAPDGRLHYAALLGSSSQNGSRPFYGEFPAEIQELVRRVPRS